MFGPRSALWLRDMNTGTERVVMDPIEVEMAEQYGTPRILPGYSWATDSKSIVISQGGKLHRLWTDSGKVENIPFEAHVHRTISEMAKVERRIGDGPFPGYVFYGAATTYSGLYTCNTWTIEGLDRAGLHGGAIGVLFAYQAMDRAQAAALRRTPQF